MKEPFPFLSPVSAAAPRRLLDQARGLPVPRVALVNAGGINALQGIREAAEAGLAHPVLIGDAPKIRQIAEQIGWDISALRMIHAPQATARACCN